MLLRPGRARYKVIVRFVMVLEKFGENVESDGDVPAPKESGVKAMLHLTDGDPNYPRSRSGGHASHRTDWLAQSANSEFNFNGYHE